MFKNFKELNNHLNVDEGTKYIVLNTNNQFSFIFNLPNYLRSVFTHGNIPFINLGK